MPKKQEKSKTLAILTSISPLFYKFYNKSFKKLNILYVRFPSYHLYTLSYSTSNVNDPMSNNNNTKEEILLLNIN